MIKKFIYVFMVAAFGLFAAGCATIVHGTSTRISIDTVPEGAIARVGEQMTTTPGTLIVKNSQPGVIEIQKDGYQPATYYLQQQMSGWVWGNVLVGGFIGIGIDFISGGAYKLTPKDINLSLIADGNKS